MGGASIMDIISYVKAKRALKEATKPITPDRATFFEGSINNLYNYEMNTDHIRFDPEGVPKESDLYTATDYIKVEAGTYTIGFPESADGFYMSYVPFYNENKELDSVIHSSSTFSGQSENISVPASGYVRLAINIDYKDEMVFAKQEDYITGEYIPYQPELASSIKATPKRKSVTSEIVAEKAIQTTHTNFIEAGKNLFNKNDVELDTFYSTYPGKTELSGYFTTNNAIPLEANKSYTISHVRQWFLLDGSGNEIDNNNTGDNSATVTIETTEASFFAFSGSMDNLHVTQMEEGTETTYYEAYKKTFPEMGFTNSQVSEMTRSLNSAGEVVRVSKTGENFNITSDFGNESIVIKTKRYSGDRNRSFNFVETNVGNLTIHKTDDDIVPIRTFNTVGGNHGYTAINIITMSGHDKTTADLGSQWTDGETTYTLLKIEGDDLIFGCPYTENSSGIVSSSRVVPVTNLTHVSGATNTAEVDITNTSGGQLYPSIKDATVQYFLDGNELTDDGEYAGKELRVWEEYTIMDYKAIIDYAQANVGSFYGDADIDGVVKLSNTFTFTYGGKCTTSHGFLALKPVSVANCGFLQSYSLTASNHTRKRFMPNVASKNGFDFPSGVDLDAYDTDTNFDDADLIDPNVPPSYYVDWLYNSNGDKAYGFSLGYIVDKTNSKNADRVANTTRYWDMRGTTKSYPVAIRGLEFSPGDYMSFQGFRNYITPEEVGNAENLNVVKDKKDTYVYTHFTEQVSGEKKLLPNDLGKEAELVQGDLSLMNDVVDTNGVTINTSSALSHGVIKCR